MNDNRIIKKIIEFNKPINIEKYIQLCLNDDFGYYNNSIAIGKKGDFITSPEISQLFGEILGLFIYFFWDKNINEKFNFVELGPGRGTLLIDILNITKSYNHFSKSATIHLIEQNKLLIAEQKKNLKKIKIYSKDIKWLKLFNIYNKQPTIIFANEFFDCLPIRQFFKKNIDWYEKMIFFNKDSECLQFMNKKITDNLTLSKLSEFKKTETLEISNSRDKYFSRICKHIDLVGGMIILIDYGYFDQPNYFTLQSLYNNKKTNILDDVGSQDITSLVDFKKLIFIAKSNNLNVDIFCTQREFFLQYGIKERAKIVNLNSSRDQKKIINDGVERIINNNKMGSLFKVLVVSK
jgi:NADH dehydrogenase [ubiquinone] 1 alpha subcomplex assembly factor 7